MKLSTTAPLCLVAIALLALSTTATAQMPDRAKLRAMKDDPKAPIEIVSTYLTMASQIRDSLVDPLTVLIIAQHDMKDVLRKTGDPAKAVAEFRRILDGLEDPAARAAVRFTIVDVYQAADEPEKALAELRLLVDETKVRLDAKK